MGMRVLAPQPFLLEGSKIPPFLIGYYVGFAGTCTLLGPESDSEQYTAYKKWKGIFFIENWSTTMMVEYPDASQRITQMRKKVVCTHPALPGASLASVEVAIIFF
jgi:hypothetical protein